MKYLYSLGAALAPLVDRHTVAAYRAHVTKDALCFCTGGTGGHASRDKISYSHLEMKQQLVVDR